MKILAINGETLEQAELDLSKEDVVKLADYIMALYCEAEDVDGEWGA